MVWALWGIDTFLAPASSLVATLTVSWLPRSKVLNRVSYYTSTVNSSPKFCLFVFVFCFVLCMCVGGLSSPPHTLWKLAAILTF
jgi:hypothetical protein